MADVNLWQAAIHCEKARKAATDPYLRTVFAKLRDLWIALADQSPVLNRDQLANEIGIISSIQAQFTAPAGQTIH
jgi:hypothetical protein